MPVPDSSKSAAPTLTTVSEKVTRHVRLSAFVGVDEGACRSIDDTVGPVSSHSTMTTSGAAGAVFTPSVAASLTTVSTTSTSPSGVTTSAYSVLPDSVNVFFIPPLTVTSPISKSVTSSEKVNVTVNGAVLLIFSGTPIATVGATTSHCAVADSAAAGPVFTPSVAASFATVTTTSLSSSGVTTIV